MAGKFSLRLDEFVNIAGDPQLMVFKYNFDWLTCLAVCTDGASSMMGSHVGFVTRTERENPDVIMSHCFLHENLASQRLQPKHYVVLNDVIQVVNVIKARALNSRIFHKMCEEMGSHHLHLLFHSDVRWLSRGRVLELVIERKIEREVFLQEKKLKLADCFKDPAWVAKVIYLGDIFRHMNEENSDMQARNQTMKDKLQEEMDRYLPESIDLRQDSWVRNMFGVNVSEDGEHIPGFQEELIDLQENQVQRQRFESLSYSEFWAQLKDNPILTHEAEKALPPYPTT
ncbi:protein FAM200B-like [Panulirus ornatus]|uniref:protein FAM200B-like n=1 Tax=Panulirus ornatus TaxID=150431 RepID=UPI003A8C562C